MTDELTRFPLWLAALVCAVQAVSCDDYPLGVDGLAPIVTVEVEPADAVVEVTTGGPAEVLQYSATITREDGSVDQSTSVDWESSNQTVGEIDTSGMFTANDSTGGRTSIRAGYMGAWGQASLTVVYAEQVVTDGAPEDAPDLFDTPPVVDPDAPVLLYPFDQVRIPRNTPQITFQWDPGPTCNLFLLRFASEVTQVDVYTDEHQWTPDEQLWYTIAAANAGGTTTLELLGLAYDEQGSLGGDGEPLTIGTPTTIHISRLDAQGSVFYWNASIGGVYRIPFGSSEPEEFYGQNNYGHCVSCHVISPDGSQMAVTYDRGNGPMGLVSMDAPLDDGQATIPYSGGEVGNFKTFSPDGSALLSSFNGVLRMHDAASGEEWYTLDLAFKVTQPSWSPLGDRIAVVLPDESTYVSDWSFNSGRIALLHVDANGTIGVEPEIIVSSEDGSNNYYPTFSPDGDWIAYNRSWNTDGTAESWDSYNDDSATLMVVRSDGSVGFEMATANGDGYLCNSWPFWAPMPDADVLWLAFSSKRPYGFLSSIEGNRPQIWVAAFDLQVAAGGGGGDPSSPPFWLPFQDPDTSNHIAIWGPT